MIQRNVQFFLAILTDSKSAICDRVEYIKRSLIRICRNKMDIPLGEGDGDSLLFKGLVDGIHELMRGMTSVPWIFYPAQ